MRTCRSLVIILLALLFLLGSGEMPVRADKKLPVRYRQWLEKDVAYLITKEEKELFLKLQQDEEREKFIERFWEIRNPTPGAPTNPFKEEHYRRLEYAEHYFGLGSGTDGWRTDRGRVYILFGPPQQRAFHTSHQKLRPIEIWFYSSSHPALPPFFYLLFYQRDNIGDFRLYSPYFDGPDKLITSHQAQSGRLQSLRVIQEAAGREVARISLSLIPNEPVDLESATASLQSDLLVSAIRNLANHPLNKNDLDRRRALMERVTHRLIVEGEILKVLTVPLRGPDGNINLHYVLRLSKPEDFTLGQSDGGRYYYSVAVTARVFGPDNKLIFTQEKTLSRYFEKTQVDQIKNKVFGYQSWLPLPPGKYKLEFLLTNNLKQVAFRAEKSVVIPEVPTDAARLVELVPFSEAERVDPARSNVIPFTIAGVKFTPLPEQGLELTPGQDLNVFYQVWAPPRDPRQYEGKKLQVEYVYGRPGSRGESRVVRDELEKGQFDPAGSLISGKKISLADLPLGNYLLTTILSDPDSQHKTYGTLAFRVSSAPSSPPVWDIYDEELGDDLRKGVVDYQRGLSYLAAGNADRAMAWFRAALQKDPTNEQVRSKLVELHFARQQFAEVASLYRDGQAKGSNPANEQTLIWIAESLEKTGDTKSAIVLLESALASNSESNPVLYLTLANFHRKAGNLDKATELERIGKSRLAAGSNSPKS